MVLGDMNQESIKKNFPAPRRCPQHLLNPIHNTESVRTQDTPRTKAMEDQKSNVVLRRQQVTAEETRPMLPGPGPGPSNQSHRTGGGGGGPTSSMFRFDFRDRRDVSAKRKYRVNVPTKLILTLVFVFLIAPLSIFMYKEKHIHDKRYEGHYKSEKFVNVDTNEVLSHLVPSVQAQSNETDGSSHTKDNNADSNADKTGDNNVENNSNNDADNNSNNDADNNSDKTADKFAENNVENNADKNVELDSDNNAENAANEIGSGMNITETVPQNSDKEEGTDIADEQGNR